MSNNLHSTSLSYLFLIFNLLFFLLLIFKSTHSIDLNYPNCPAAFNCSNVTIRYPFWRIDSEPTTQFCGYQGFGISCSYNGVRNISGITLGGVDYYVKNINYESRSINVINYDVSPAFLNVSTCPRMRHNISLETLAFNFSVNSVNLSFHFNCTQGRGFPSFAISIPCLGDGSRVNIINSESNKFDWGVHSCDQEVVTTVFQDEDIPLPNSWETALQRGFGLNWRRTDVDCEKCEESNGRCGRHNSTGFMCFCSNGTTTKDNCKSMAVNTAVSISGSKLNWKLELVLGFGSALLLVVFLVIIYFITKSSSSNCVFPFVHKTEDHQSVEAFVIQHGSLTMKRYNYHDIKKMTKSFQVKLGQGGFGTVYKGKLSDGRLVAIKVLNTSKASGQEFINEVASISRTSHVNIVTLLGYCFDYKRRALVYEFMQNGSLEKFIHRHVSNTTSEQIDMHKLHEIALGIARGLDYLHRGCNTRILHLDIKPHNILLDEDFFPKIADFGLAKLYSRKDSIVSMLEARGTIGYIAPEVFNRNFGGVSHKSDVYSYGMLILEMVGGRKNVDGGVCSGRTSEIYFPYWIYNRLEKTDFLLDSIKTTQENDYARKMTIVGLWCIQTDPNQRPSIDEVIEMLEGSMEGLEVPPKPFFSSSLRSPATTFATSSTTLTTSESEHEESILSQHWQGL